MSISKTAINEPQTIIELSKGNLGISKLNKSLSESHLMHSTNQIHHQHHQQMEQNSLSSNDIENVDKQQTDEKNGCAIM